MLAIQALLKFGWGNRLPSQSGYEDRTHEYGRIVGSAEAKVGG